MVGVMRTLTSPRHAVTTCQAPTAGGAHCGRPIAIETHAAGLCGAHLSLARARRTAAGGGRAPAPRGVPAAPVGIGVPLVVPASAVSTSPAGARLAEQGMAVRVEGTKLVVSGLDGEPYVDGPSRLSIVDALGELRDTAVLANVDQLAPYVVVERTFSDRAYAIAVLRLGHERGLHTLRDPLLRARGHDIELTKMLSCDNPNAPQGLHPKVAAAVGALLVAAGSGDEACASDEDSRQAIVEAYHAAGRWDGLGGERDGQSYREGVTITTHALSIDDSDDDDALDTDYDYDYDEDLDDDAV